MLGLIATSCEDSLEPPTPQENEQTPVLTTGDITTETAGVLASGSVNLNDYVESPMVPVLRLDQAVNLPAGATVDYKLEVSDTPTFAKSVVLDTHQGESEDDLSTFYVDADAWSSAQLSLFGKDSGFVTTYYRVPVYVILENSNYRYNALDFYAVEGEVSVKRMLPKEIENTYYLVGSFCDWNLSQAVKMSNTKPEETDVYKNPVFSVILNVTESEVENGVYWMIVPESTVIANDYGKMAYGAKPNSTGALAGELVEVNAKDTEAGSITLAGPVMITANIENMTYTEGYAIDNLYVYSASDNVSALPTNDYFNYSGVAILEGNVNIVNDPNQIVVSLLQKTDGEMKYDKGVFSGDLTSKAALGQPLSVAAEAGKYPYWVDINLSTFTYKFQVMKAIHVVGDFPASNWNVEESPAFVPVDNNMRVWKLENLELNTMFKIACNSGWEINFGVADNTPESDEYTLSFNAGNIPSTPGTYDLTLDFTSYPYTLTVTSK